MDVKFVCSLLFVKNLKASRHFYEDILKQKVALDVGENITYESGFAIQDADHISNLIFKKKSDKENPMGRDNFELYFETTELDSILSVMKTEKADFVHDVEEQPWGQRVFRVYDPDRYIIEIGEHLSVTAKRFLNQGMSAQQVHEKLFVPIEYVEKLSKELNQPD